MSQLLSIIGWYFVPGLVTSVIQTIYYRLTIRAGDPKPARNSARFLAHRRTIHVAVVAAYLLYTVYDADRELRAAPSFYQELGVPVSADDRDVKSRFRRLAALHHPDKVGGGGGGGGGGAGPDSSDFFIHLKVASDTLQDAAKRFAYERFGPDIVSWPRCVTVRDFVSRGVLQGTLPHYGVAAMAVYLIGLFGYMEFGKFYRWLVLLALCLFELHAVTRPAFPPAVRLLNAVVTRLGGPAPYLPFQAITLMRKLALTVYIALSQIGPLLVEQAQARQRSSPAGDKALQLGLDRLEAVTKQLDADTVRLIDMELAPFKGDPELASSLQGKMREWLVQNTIRADPLVRDAMGIAFRKRRMDAPSGARGNR